MPTFAPMSMTTLPSRITDFMTANEARLELANEDLVDGQAPLLGREGHDEVVDAADDEVVTRMDDRLDRAKALMEFELVAVGLLVQRDQTSERCPTRSRWIVATGPIVVTGQSVPRSASTAARSARRLRRVRWSSEPICASSVRRSGHAAGRSP